MADRAGSIHRESMGRTPAQGYVHDALVCSSDAELTGAAAPFITGGLSAGETIAVICRERTAALLLDMIDDPRVRLLPREEVYARPAGAIARYGQLVQQAKEAGTGRIRILGEVDFGAGPQEWAEWRRYEAATNQAMVDHPLWAMCVYDTRELPEEVLESAAHTHPNLVTATERSPSSGYVPPAEYLREPAPVTDRPVTAATMWAVRTMTDLAELRSDIQAYAATRSPLPPNIVDDFVLAVNEIATNGLRHGHPPVTARIWDVPGRLVCAVTDQGPGFEDPMAGYHPAGGDLTGGHGLWMARRLCDHLEITRSPAGFTVQLAVDWT